ncbi:unnamed protein product [Linum trigynum]|uniref:Uncharacterized protein n=1 Tax=Linum trigynum TaxID=586398 RepID=A0AAV2D9I3_9ROSI
MNQGGLDFREWAMEMNLIDHKIHGSSFTWWNKQSTNPIAKRLDRFLVNEEWFISFPQSVARTLAPGVSNHCGLVLDSDPKLGSLPKPFKYFKFWQKHPQYWTLLEEAWSGEARGLSYQRFYYKLKQFKAKLKQLNLSEYSEISERARAAEKALEQQQQLVLQDPTAENVGKEAELAALCHDTQRAEESFFRQKSRIRSIQEGDANTAYFHAMVRIRNHKQTIMKLVRDDNTEVIEVKEMGEVAVALYKRLSGEVDKEVQYNTVDYFQNQLRQRLDPEGIQVLLAPVTREEIREVFKKMPNDKAPGPDGFTAEFYKSD